MSELDQIKKNKEKIREALKADNADGITGTGINPIEEKLLVFTSDQEKAKETLRALGIDLPSNVVLRKLDRQYVQPPSRLRLKRLSLCSTEEPTHDSVSLSPSIPPITPECGSEGLAGCFVSLNNGNHAVLTAEHLFYRREKHAVHFKSDSYTGCILAGTTKDYGGLKPAPEVSAVDCATFLASGNVTLSRSNDITGNFIRGDDLPLAVKMSVKRIGGEGQGQILDTDAMIKYGAFLDKDWKYILLDGQILIRSVNKDLGNGGDSGSLVVIAETTLPFQEGDGLGLYVALTAAREYHFVTPLHSCLKAVGATGIYNPPAASAREKRVSSAQAIRTRRPAAGSR